MTRPLHLLLRVHKQRLIFCSFSRTTAMSDDEGAARRFTILYGSQTGNAEDVAERIARQARRRRIATDVHAMDEYDIVSASECMRCFSQWRH